ncbi:MAG: carbonic anhydrase [Candidatus Wallbacteria bacterium]
MAVQNGSSNFKCEYCGNKLPETSYICPNCGKVCKEKVQKVSVKNKNTPASPNETNAKKAGQKSENTFKTGDSYSHDIKTNIDMGGTHNQVFNELKTDDFKPSAIEIISNTESTPKINIDFLNSSNKNTQYEVDEMVKPIIDLNQNSSLKTSYMPGEKKHHESSIVTQPLKSDMTLLNNLLKNNQKFIAAGKMKGYKPGEADRPRLKLAILTCMSSKLSVLIEESLGLTSNDAITIRVAGASIIECVSSEVLRSLALAVHKYGVEEIAVISHDDCGMRSYNVSEFLNQMKNNGLTRSLIDIPDIKTFIGGFSNVKENLRRTVSCIKRSRIIPDSIAIHGLLLNTKSGIIETIVNGYNERVII